MNIPRLDQLADVIRAPDGGITYKIKGSDVLFRVAPSNPLEKALVQAFLVAKELREKEERVLAEKAKKQASAAAVTAPEHQIASPVPGGAAESEKPSLWSRLKARAVAFVGYLNPFKSRSALMDRSPVTVQPSLQAVPNDAAGKEAAKTEPNEKSNGKTAILPPLPSIVGAEVSPSAADPFAPKNPLAAVAVPTDVKPVLAAMPKLPSEAQAEELAVDSSDVKSDNTKPEPLFRSINDDGKAFRVVLGDGYELIIDKASPEAKAFEQVFAEAQKFSGMYNDLKVSVDHAVAEKKQPDVAPARDIRKGTLTRIPSPVGGFRYAVELGDGRWQALNLAPSEIGFLDTRKDGELGLASVSVSKDFDVVLEGVAADKNSAFVALKDLMNPPAAGTPAVEGEDPSAEENVNFDDLKAHPAAPSKPAPAQNGPSADEEIAAQENKSADADHPAADHKDNEEPASSQNMKPTTVRPSISEEQKYDLIEAMDHLYLSPIDDGSNDSEVCGFKTHHALIGKKLAGLVTLTDAEAAVARDLAQFYSEKLARHNPELLKRAIAGVPPGRSGMHPDELSQRAGWNKDITVSSPSENPVASANKATPAVENEAAVKPTTPVTPSSDRGGIGDEQKRDLLLAMSHLNHLDDGLSEPGGFGFKKHHAALGAKLANLEVMTDAEAAVARDLAQFYKEKLNAFDPELLKRSIVGVPPGSSGMHPDELSKRMGWTNGVPPVRPAVVFAQETAQKTPPLSQTSITTKEAKEISKTPSEEPSNDHDDRRVNTPAIEQAHGFLLEDKVGGKPLWSVAVPSGVFNMNLDEKQEQALRKYAETEAIYYVAFEPGITELTVSGFLTQSMYEAGETVPTPASQVFGTNVVAAWDKDEDRQRKWQREQMKVGIAPTFKKTDKPTPFDSYTNHTEDVGIDR